MRLTFDGTPINITTQTKRGESAWVGRLTSRQNSVKQAVFVKTKNAALGLLPKRRRSVPPEPLPRGESLARPGCRGALLMTSGQPTEGKLSARTEKSIGTKSFAEIMTAIKLGSQRGPSLPVVSLEKSARSGVSQRESSLPANAHDRWPTGRGIPNVDEKITSLTTPPRKISIPCDLGIAAPERRVMVASTRSPIFAPCGTSKVASAHSAPNYLAKKNLTLTIGSPSLAVGPTAQKTSGSCTHSVISRRGGRCHQTAGFPTNTLAAA